MIHCLMNQTRTSRYPTIRCQRTPEPEMVEIHSPKSLNRMNHCLKTQTQTQTQKNRYRKIRCLKSRSLRNQNRMIRYLTCRIPKSLNQMTRCPRSPNRTIRYLTNQCRVEPPLAVPPEDPPLDVPLPDPLLVPASCARTSRS